MSVHLHFLLILTGLTGINSMTTVSKVSVKAGASISIPCLYHSRYINHVKGLCKGYYWNFCSYAVKTNRKNSRKFSISDDKSQRIFTVTIKDLTKKNTDYWCAVENDETDVREYFQLSVTRGPPSLYVDQQEITGFIGDDITINCYYHNSGDFKWCRLGGSCLTRKSVSFYGTRLTINRKIPNVFTVTMSGLSTESSGWYLCVKGELQMPVHLTVEELPTTRINSITTVSKVSVKAGASISIPCLYDSRYINHVKGLCKRSNRFSCSNAVKTNRQKSGKFSVSDDKSQRIFTVTIKDLTDKDTDYWCAVEIDEESYIRTQFDLSVTRGPPSLYVDNQTVTGFKGDNITISCHYTNSGDFKWCRLGGSCVTSPSGSIDGTTVSINASVPNVFTVTMSGLSTESSGWYLCVKGDLQMPVHLTVEELPTTNAPPTTVQHNQSVSVDLKPFIIPLGLLIFIVMVTLFIFFMLKRHKQTKAESSATATAKEEVTYSVVQIKRKTPAQAEEEVTYSEVKHMKKTPDERSDAKSDVDVTYSSVVIAERQTVERVEAKDEDVTYSSLAQQQQKL